MSTRDFQSRSCILQNSLTPWNLKAGKSFKTEVCAKTANPQITMSWITEVEKAKSIMTNRVHRNQFLGEQISQIVKCWM